MTELARIARASSASHEQKEAAINKAHDYILIGYTLINAADILMRRTVKIMSDVNTAGYSYSDKFNIADSLRKLKDIISRTERNSVRLDDALAEEQSSAYDRLRLNAYEMVRFTLLLYSRTCGDSTAANDLEQFMREMKSNELFSDNEIASFSMK